MNYRRIKVVILGDSYVGKSSIIRRLVTGEFNQDEESTIGAAYVGEIMDSEDNNVKYSIWDTAGQEKYRTLTKMYYRDAQVAILVYDINKYSSFSGLKQWVKEIEINGPKNIQKILVGNKEDLINQEVVPIDEALSYAESVDASYSKVSAKTNVGVSSILEAIAKKKQCIDNQSVYGDKRESLKLTREKRKKRKCC